MRLPPDEARRRFVAEPVARLATVGADGVPTIVPICFVVPAETLYSAVDDKPKASGELQRLADVRATSIAAALVDHYEEDWSRLWWVRARGPARVIGSGPEREMATAALRERYAQYATHRLGGPVVAIDVEEWRGWAAT